MPGKKIRRIPWAEKLKEKQVSQVLWKPHKTNNYRVVAIKRHFSPSGLLIKAGYHIDFCSPENRNRWLASQYPKRYARLAPKTR